MVRAPVRFSCPEDDDLPILEDRVPLSYPNRSWSISQLSPSDPPYIPGTITNTRLCWVLNSAMAEPGILAHVRSVWDRIRPTSPIYDFLLSDVSLLSAADGLIVAHLDVTHVHVNSKGTLHGSVSTCLIDWASSMAIASTGRDKTGVSTDLHASYVSTAKVGDILKIKGMASKVGANMAYTTVDVSRIRDGTVELVCHGLHTKFVR